MLYPLYEYYSQSPMDLYQIRNHFLNNFYYQDHSRNQANHILRVVVNSSKIDRLIKESLDNSVVPTYDNYLNVISSMWKFIFKSIDTQVLAVIYVAIRWDIEVNQKLHLVTSEQLKQEVVKVFDKLQVYKVMSKEEFFSVVTPTVDMEAVENEPKKLPKLKTWSLMAFTKEFGDMKVEQFANGDTGEIFHSCVFIKGYNKTFVGFSSKLGELTDDEINDKQDELVVIQQPNGKYKLAKRGRGY